MAQGRHKSAKVLPRYVKRTMRQVEAGAKKRRAIANKRSRICQNERQPACQNGPMTMAQVIEKTGAGEKIEPSS